MNKEKFLNQCREEFDKQLLDMLEDLDSSELTSFDNIEDFHVTMNMTIAPIFRKDRNFTINVNRKK